MMLNSHKKTQS